MNIEVEVQRALESVKADLLLVNLRVDSVLQSMKEQSTQVGTMVTTLKAIIEIDSLNQKAIDGDMTSTKSL